MGKQYGKGGQYGKHKGNQKGGYARGKKRANKQPDQIPTIKEDAPIVRFDALPIHDETKAALEAMGFSEATPIQGATIPLLLEGRDVLGQAQTGTGKTAAFGVPLIEASWQGGQGLVLAPTRELAKQVQQELQAIGKGSPVEAICIVGGAPFKDQLRAMDRHPNAIIVGTPGRIVDHLGRGTIDLTKITMFVLDEADEMLSMGFQDELDAIVQSLPQERQNVMFSATMPHAVEQLAKRALRNPELVRAAAGPAPTIEQCYVQVAGRDRADAIGRIIEAEDPTSVLLFGRTRNRVEELVEMLAGIGAEALHGGMDQRQRESVMRRFRDESTRLLVATDVAARGLDVDTVELVLHDELPDEAEVYIHRIGRTGRAGREGRSIVFVRPGKLQRLKPIERIAGTLEPYKIPGDEVIAALKAQRLVAQLEAVVPSDAARDALQQLLDGGMPAYDVALKLLENQMTVVETPEAVAQTTTGLALKVGKMDDIRPGAIVGVLTNAGGLRAQDVGRIDILDKMSVVEIPTDQVERVCEALGRIRLSNRPLLPRAADDWRFKAMRRL